MIHKPLEQISEEDLQSLVTNKVSEDRQLEYKQSLPGASDGEVREFLKDVSAMANSQGGYIIYGIEESVDENGNTGASKVQGVSGENADHVKLRLENIIRDCIKPRIVGIGTQDVHLANSNSVFIIHIPRSWSSPHVVEHKGHWRFYYRDSAGTHPMDVTELRHSMTLSDTLAQRLEDFRLNRVARIAGDDGLGNRAKIILHLQPFSSTQPNGEIDLRMARRNHETLILMRLIDSSITTPRPNFDGLLSYLPEREAGWLQIFRNGVIEAVDTVILEPGSDGKRTIYAYSFERALLEATAHYLRLLNNLSVPPPIMLTLTLLGVRGYSIAISGDDIASWDPMATYHLQRRAEQTPIDRNDLFLSGTMIDDLEADVNELLRPSFDAIWNAAGFDGSLFYDSRGQRTKKITQG